MLRVCSVLPTRPVRSTTALLAAAALALSAACSSKPGAPAAATPSADAWATVDGREITRDAVEKAYRRTTQGTAPSEEEALTAKLSLLNDLVIQDILLAKARELKIEVPDAEVDAAFAEGRRNIPDEAFQQELARRNLTAADMRDGIKRELTTQKVLEREVTSKVSIADNDVTDYFNRNRAQFNVAEESFHIAQIVVTPVRDPQLDNRTGDDATTPDAAARKAQMLLERLKSGTPFGDLAADFSEDPQSAPRGGDLGLIPRSALNQVPPRLRDVVLKSTPGTVSTVSGGGVHTLVLLVSKEAAGQRDLNTPAVREGITATLRGRKEQLLRAAFLSAVRSEAAVANHVARRVLESPGTLPTLAPKAPGAP